jgi:hypothetical protein
MKEFPWVEGYQIAQRDAGAVVVNLVTRQPLTPGLTEPVEAALRKKTGADMRIEFRRVAELRKNASGKTPIVMEGP